MKIVIIGSAHPLRGGGISTFNERLASVLIELGHDVNIVSFSLQYPNFLFPGKSQFTDEPTPKGLKILSWINSINPINWIQVGRKISRLNPDVVITRFWLPFFGPCLGTINRMIKKNNNSKIIAILDNVIPHESRVGDQPFTNYFLKSCDAYLTMSREVMQDLKKFKVDKPVEYTPHPMYDNYGEAIDQRAARTKLGLNPDGFYLLFFGFIRKYKGLDLLLEAMADPRIKNTKIHLIVAGEYYGDEAYYQSLIQSLDISDKLSLFTEFIPNDEVRYYFSACDVVVQPYRTATQSGISQIAYHFNKPMIVTNVGGLPEIVQDGVAGYVVSPKPKEIADAIIKISESSTLRKLEEGVNEEKKKYGWDTFVDAIFSLKNDL